MPSASKMASALVLTVSKPSRKIALDIVVTGVLDAR